MPLIIFWVLLLAVLATGGSLYGVNFFTNAWNAAGAGVRNALASRIFNVLTFVFALSLGIPVLGIFIGLVLAHLEEAGPEVAMWVIVSSLALPVGLLLVVVFGAGFLGEVSYYLSPLRSLEELQKGIRKKALGGIVALLTVGGLVAWLGVFATSIVLAVAAYSGLLLWAVSEYYYGGKTVWLRRLAVMVGLLPLLWTGAAAIPGSFWLALHLPNIRPIINFWEGPDNIALDAATKSEAKSVKNFCSRGLKTLAQQISSTGSIAVIGEKKRLRVSLEEACGRGDLNALAGLETQIWPPKTGP